MPRAFPTVLLTVWLLVLTTAVASSQTVDYLQQIKPILRARCFACHGVLKQEAGLRLDTGALIRRGAESGIVVTPRKPDQSLLLERLSAEDEGERMPPEGEPLSPAQIELVRRWIKQGAVSPNEERPEEDPRSHWAFRRPSRDPLPTSKQGRIANHPIDAFLLAKLAQQGLAPQPLADRSRLLRRVYLDLIGVPPTRDELRAFLADASPAAWETVVDRLLADPRHGERWARHWMDVWRYSDWYGRRHVPDVWNSAPQVWRWRDWIVKSLNQDRGYDRMVAEMLAGDEIAPEDREAGYATGYLVRNWYALNPNDWMRANVEHTGKAFLGLTFNCAHCHDHKYDPISHNDYFRLRAFFEPLYVRQDRAPGEADPGPFQDYSYSTLRKIQHLGAVRVFDKTPDAPTWFYTGGDERNRQQARGSIAPGVPAFLGEELPAIEAVQLPPRAWYPGFDPQIQQTVLDDVQRQVDEATAKLAAARTARDSDAQTISAEVAKAEAALASAIKQAKSDAPPAIVGKQSLVFNALQGRRVLHNRLSKLKKLDQLPDGLAIEFRLLLGTDAHFNFQFAKDTVKGLTASCVVFEAGHIRSYQPGSFTEFEVGSYDFAKGQRGFQVRFVLQPKQDRCLLTIRSDTDQVVLAKAVPVALNGWNPLKNPGQAILLDARTGSLAAIDQFRVMRPATDANSAESEGQAIAQFTFEGPDYPLGRDVVGIGGWEHSSFSAPPATSRLASTLGDARVAQAEQELATARRASRLPDLRWQAAQAQLQVAQSELAGVEARVAADRARYGGLPSGDAKPLIAKAIQAEQSLRLRKLEAEVAAQDYALVQAEAQPSDDKQRGKQVAAATRALMAARTAWQKAQQAPTKKVEDYTAFSPTYPRTSTGRRSALAAWITAPTHPLTSRVAVNHIWMRHFHAPLVKSVYDFGRNGTPPSHPKLLDWLAVELVESGWSMKRLHRLIVTSAAYRRQTGSAQAASQVAADPENRWLWRMNTGRMEAEVVRDSLLYCGGRLDLKMGGRSLENKFALTTFRRSLYYEVYPEDGGASDLSTLFDAPNPLDCYRRTRSIVPQQALALTNSELVHQVSQQIVVRWNRDQAAPTNAAVDPERGSQFITEMFEQILSRQPTAAERQVCMQGLTRQVKLLTAAGTADALQRARESLVRALLNHNDFVTIR